MKLLPEYTDKYQSGMVNRRNKNKSSPTGEMKNKGMFLRHRRMRLQNEINQWEETLRMVLNEKDKIEEAFAGIGFSSKKWSS